MNLKEVQALSDKELKIKVAELCGWRYGKMAGKFYHDTTPVPHSLRMLPNYPQDLNAMHEAEKAIDDSDINQYGNYVDCLTEMGGNDYTRRWDCARATARQRAEAFVLTMEVGE